MLGLMWGTDFLGLEMSYRIRIWYILKVYMCMCGKKIVVARKVLWVLEFKDVGSLEKTKCFVKFTACRTVFYFLLKKLLFCGAGQVHKIVPRGPSRRVAVFCFWLSV